MNESKIYSFSANKESDKKLIDELKADSKAIGVKFNWVVLQALRQYQESKNAKAN